MSRATNISGNLVTFTAGAANATNSVLHGLPSIPQGFIIVGQNAAGRLYRPSNAVYAAIDADSAVASGYTGRWTFEDGDFLGDSTANNLDLTDSGTVTSVAGKIGKASNYVAASSQYLYRASEANLQTGDIDYTLAAWVNMATITGDMCVVSKDNNAANTREYVLAWNPTIGFYFRMFKAPADAMAGNAQTGIVGFANLTWYLVIAWHDSVANTINIQVNDSAVVSNATTGAQQAASTAQCQIGARQYATSRIFMNGKIDQVMFWKRVLTSAERSLLYTTGNLPNILTPWTSTIAYIASATAGVTYTVLFFA